MPTSVAVVDASVVAAALFGEPGSDWIDEALDGSRLVAPALMRYEVCRVCQKKAVRHPEKRELLLASLDGLERLEVRELTPPARDLVELAEEASVTAYDAAYLWLALHLDAPLHTLDRELRAAYDRLEPESR